MPTIVENSQYHHRLQTNKSQAILPHVHTGDDVPDFEMEDLDEMNPFNNSARKSQRS